jgi:hypothetical protein
MEDVAPPRRLSSTLGHSEYRPDALRVGVRINGEEAKTCIWYDMDLKAYRVQGDMPTHTRLATTIEPYWRYPETRQLRRARERWESRKK